MKIIPVFPSRYVISHFPTNLIQYPGVRVIVEKRKKIKIGLSAMNPSGLITQMICAKHKKNSILNLCFV